MHGAPGGSSSSMVGACVLLLILVASSWSWWKTTSKSNDTSCSEEEDGVAGAVPPPGPWSSRSRLLRLVWRWRETAAFLASHGSGRGFYHFVHTRYLRHQGPCFRTALLGRVHVFLSASHPAASHLLTAQPPHFAKRYARTAADLLGAHSILCCTSHAHHRHARRALATLFATPSTAAFAKAFDRLATDLIIRHWSITHNNNKLVVVLDAALEISYRAICEMLVGGAGAGRLARLQSDVFAVTQAMLALPLRWVPGTRFRRGLEARKRVMVALREEMAARRHHHHQHDDDLLSVLMQRRQAGHPDALTDEQIQDNMLTLIIAGQVTTATAITWMVKYLSDNRLIQDKLRAEAFGLELQGDYSLTLQDLNGMDYAYKAVKESLRMATIVSWFPRVALKDCQVAGFHIKKDWIVNIDARSLHYDPAVFDNPTVFDPSRFNGEGEGDDLKLGRAQAQAQQHERRLLVFGAGGRTCLGMNLAKIMMLIFLHRLLTNFRWEMADDDPSLEKWAMFPRLKNGCPILLTPIHDS